MAKSEPRKRRKEVNDPDLKKVMTRVAKNVESKRKRVGTLQEVASKAGVTTSTLWEIEKDKAPNIKLHTLVSIARALDLDLIDLLK